MFSLLFASYAGNAKNINDTTVIIIKGDWSDLENVINCHDDGPFRCKISYKIDL